MAEHPSSGFHDASDFEAFERLVARHGTDRADWPDGSLAESASGDAARLALWLSDEDELDAHIRAALPTTPLSANFSDRVIARLDPSSRARIHAPRAFLAACLGIVAVAGAALFALGQGGLSDTDGEAWETLAEGTGFSELYAWTYASDDNRADEG